MQAKTRMIAALGGAALLALVVAGAAIAHGQFGTRNETSTSATVDASTGTISSIGYQKGNATAVLLESARIAIPVGAAPTNDSRRGYVVRDDVGDVLAVEGPGLRAASVNGTTVTLVLPAGATVVAHDEVADWSPAGATVTYADGTKANLVLSKNATLHVDGQTLTITLGEKSGLQYHLAGPEGKPFGVHGAGMGRGGPRGDHEGMGMGRGGPGGDHEGMPHRRG